MDNTYFIIILILILIFIKFFYPQSNEKFSTQEQFKYLLQYGSQYLKFSNNNFSISNNGTTFYTTTSSSGSSNIYKLGIGQVQNNSINNIITGTIVNENVNLGVGVTNNPLFYIVNSGKISFMDESGKPRYMNIDNNNSITWTKYSSDATIFNYQTIQ